MKRLLIFMTVLALFLTTSSNVLGEQPPQYFVDEAKLPFDPLPGIETTRLWGIHTNAGYRIEVPENWNGSLLMWTHGLRGVGLELIVDNPPIRELLVSNGFAWAASSYRRNNYDVATGSIDTHALTKYFNGFVGRPDYVYVMGPSMGGHIAAVMVEQWPNTYDGAIPCCGTLGDYEHINFFGNFNLAAQALTGVDTGYPLPQDYIDVYVEPIIKPGLELFPDSWPFVLNTAGENLKALTKIESGGERPTFDLAFLLWNIIYGDNFFFDVGIHPGNWVRAQGIAFDNIGKIYQFDADPALTPDEEALNETILRVARDPQSVHPNGLSNVPVVNGDIKVPVLTLHTLGDLLVPFSMQLYYAEKVAENGAEDLLVQRAIRDVFHCSFSSQEYWAAFTDLVNWVENGVKPDGDVVLDPIIVADPNYGCNFSNPERPYVDPCIIP